MVGGTSRLAVLGASVAVALSVIAPAGAKPDLSAADVQVGDAGAAAVAEPRARPAAGVSPSAQPHGRLTGDGVEVVLEPVVASSSGGAMRALVLLAGVCAACSAVGGGLAVRARHRVAHA